MSSITIIAGSMSLEIIKSLIYLTAIPVEEIKIIDSTSRQFCSTNTLIFPGYFELLTCLDSKNSHILLPRTSPSSVKLITRFIYSLSEFMSK